MVSLLIELALDPINSVCVGGVDSSCPEGTILVAPLIMMYAKGLGYKLYQVKEIPL